MFARERPKAAVALCTTECMHRMLIGAKSDHFRAPIACGASTDKSHTFSSQGDQASARPQKVERTLVPRRTHAPRRTRAGCAVGTGLGARGRRSRPPNVRHASDAQAPSLFGMLVRGDQCGASSASLKVVETRRKRCYAAPRRAVSRLQVRQTMAAGSR